MWQLTLKLSWNGNNATLIHTAEEHDEAEWITWLEQQIRIISPAPLQARARTMGRALITGLGQEHAARNGKENGDQSSDGQLKMAVHLQNVHVSVNPDTDRKLAHRTVAAMNEDLCPDVTGEYAVTTPVVMGIEEGRQIQWRVSPSALGITRLALDDAMEVLSAVGVPVLNGHLRYAAEIIYELRTAMNLEGGHELSLFPPIEEDNPFHDPLTCTSGLNVGALRPHLKPIEAGHLKDALTPIGLEHYGEAVDNL